MNLKERINHALKKRESTYALRKRIVIENSNGRFLIYNGRKYYNFSSNDYLGLSHHPTVIRAWKQGADYYGIGSGSSGHISGYTIAHHRFEKELAEWLGYQRALLFISGFAANQSIISTLMTKEDLIIADRLSHSSLLEAANFSKAKLRCFRHNDIQNIKTLLQKTCTGQKLLITEGIFSMDGDSAPLKSIYDMVKLTNSWLMVDDAHGFGVIGKNGQGSCADQNIKPEILVVTFGKAMGVSGAAVLCNHDIADYLLQYSRHLIYSTIMPPSQATALLASLNIIRSREGEEKRQKLFVNINQFCKGSTSLRLNLSNICLSESKSAIQPLLVGENLQTLNLVKYLNQRNIWTVAIRPPTVPRGTSRLRLTISAMHKKADINILLEALHDAGK